VAYAATGTITAPAPAGNGTTDLEFSLTCPTAPASQGANGWVFTLPPSAAVAGNVVGLVGHDAQGLHDLSAYVYKSDCTYSRVESGAGADLYVTLQAGDTYLSVFTANGANVTVDLVTPATPPSGSGPNDPLFNQNGAGDLFLAGQWNMRKVHAPEAWAEATGSGIKVAVLDTGLDLGHPDFNCPGKVTVVPGADPDNDSSTSPEDDEGHGTHVAGIIGACANNGIGVVGAAPGSTLMPIQVLSATADATTLETAIDTAVAQGAHVINMSLSFNVAVPVAGNSVPGSGSALGFIGSLPGIRRAIEDAVAAGVVVVAAAGNESTPLCGYPALEWNVVCVGASDPRDLNSWYGNFPVKDDDSDLTGPAVLAPGGTGALVLCDYSASEILSTYDRDADAAEGDCDTLPGYAAIQGTSMAAPLVSGIAALVYEDLGGTRSPANAAKVVEALTESAVDLYTPGYDPMSGSGRVDALAAVNYWP
jgi:serine protease